MARRGIQLQCSEHAKQRLRKEWGLQKMVKLKN